MKTKLKKFRNHPIAHVGVTEEGLIMEHKDFRWTINSVDDYNEMVDSGDFKDVPSFCSSSIDFPDEYTDNKELLNLIEEVFHKQA